MRSSSLFSSMKMIRALSMGLILSLAFAVPSLGQIRIPAEALSSSGVASSETSAQDAPGLKARINDGEDLERQRKWSDACGHYERSLKDHPGQIELQRRLTRARTFNDLERRYSDSTFLTALDRASERTALDEYTEVLRKIETYHVSVPDWTGMVRRGMTNLHYALDCPQFRQKNMPSAPPEKVRQFRQWLNQSVDPRPIRTQQQARKMVGSIANSARRQIGLPTTSTIAEFTCGATYSLDRYSSFLTAGQLEELFSQIEGNFVGLGVELKAHDKALEIVNVIPRSPAATAGIRSGEKIVEVDGHATADMSLDSAADMLKGAEGSQVQVAVVSAQGQRRSLQLMRRRVDIPSIDKVSIVDAEFGIAYLRLASFQRTTYREMKDALWKLYRDGMKSLIVDVRGNPGGLLTASVEVADLFVSKGSIVSTRGRSPREDFDHQAHAAGTWRVPLIVLIDEDTASASEIFAAAICDHGRGEIVGHQSYGKGSVQGIFPLAASKAGVRLTTSKFFSPKGKPISQQGVVPTIPVHITAKPVSSSAAPPDDLVLKASLQVARQKIVGKQAALDVKAN